MPSHKGVSDFGLMRSCSGHVQSPGISPLPVDAAQTELISVWSRGHVLPQRQVRRAKIGLLASAGTPNQEIARRFEGSEPTICKWRSRCAEAGLDGLGDEPGRGRLRTYGEQPVDRVVSVTQNTPSRGTTN